MKRRWLVVGTQTGIESSRHWTRRGAESAAGSLNSYASAGGWKIRFHVTREGRSDG